MGKTSIEWTEFSINPIRARLGDAVGHYCEKVSPGCARCYSSTLQRRFRMPEFQHQRGEAEPFLDAGKLQEVLRRRKPTTYFWCDMTDMFGEWVPDEWIAACFGVMAATPHHTHQILTKRAERMRRWFDGLPMAPHMYLAGCADEATKVTTPKEAERIYRGVEERPWPLPNVWLGVSVEDQKRADERIPHLLQTPAAIRFLSCEPLLGGVDLRRVVWEGSTNGHVDVLRGGTWSKRWGFVNHSDMPATVDWVIWGGESGNGARPMHLAWARRIVRDCEEAGVPVFGKQMGRLPTNDHGAVIDVRHRKGADPTFWPEDLMVREVPTP